MLELIAMLACITQYYTRLYHIHVFYTLGILLCPFRVPVTLQEILRVNVLGSVYTTQALLPAMITKREGKIVFISSILGQVKSNASLSSCSFHLFSYCSLVSVR